MSTQINYSYAYFDVVNFTNEFATSGYALSICPFVFKPKLDNTIFSNKRIFWDFGDGTTSKSVTATHYYDLPGEYTVSLYLYDGNNDAFYDAFTQKITVYNFVNDAIILSAGDLTFETSTLKNTFNLLRFNSWQTYNALSAIGYSVALAASGNNAPFISFQQYEQDKYAHLKKYSQFYEYAYNEDIKTFDYAAKDIISTSNVELYAKIASNGLVFCNNDDAGAVFVGTSGTAVAAYKDDMPTTTAPTLIFAHFNKTNFDAPAMPAMAAFYALPVMQTNAQSFYCTISASAPVGLHITSTGLSSMQINAVQFTNTRIPFVVQIIDDIDAPCKYCNNLKRVSSNGALSANTIQINFVDATTNAALTGAVVDDFGFFVDYDAGIYKGYCSFDVALTGVKITATAMVSSASFGVQTLSAQSPAFAVVSSNFSVAKIGEDFDQAATYKSYRFQETLLDKNGFFDGFLGTIVGDTSATPNVLGKRVYEKTTNFVGNTQDVDACNISALYSLKQMMGINVKQFDSFNFAVPANLSRLMDLLSIKQSKLWGHSNEFAENFDKKGFNYSETWGINLGDELNALTTILTAGSASKPIVSYEKFSNTYRLINTDALSSSNLQFIDESKQTYALSAYNNGWGWGLVLPDDFTSTDFDKYYIFYNYNASTHGNVIDNIINWSDANTTISRTNSSYAAWFQNNGTVQTIIANALLDGLNLFTTISGTSAQEIPSNLYPLFALDNSNTFLLLDDASVLQLA